MPRRETSGITDLNYLLQAYFGGLDVPVEVARAGGQGLAALAALRIYLHRMKADSELATSSQLVRACSMKSALRTISMRF